MANDILLICATIKEISELLKISRIHNKNTFPSKKIIFNAQIKKTSYDLLITGPSIINATHALTLALTHKRPKIIIQAGYAGIFKESNLKIGDIVIATKEKYLHMGVENKLNYRTPDALPFELIDNIPSTESGTYTLNKKYADKAFHILSKNKPAKTCSIAKGPVITVSTITSTQKTAEHLSKTLSPLMEAMEGAACAHIASLYDLPFLEIRSGSNYVGERDKSRWDMPLASSQLASAIASILEKIL